MLLLGEQDFAASGHDSLDANSLVMVTLRQATSLLASLFQHRQLRSNPSAREDYVNCPQQQSNKAGISPATAPSRIRLWLASGWGCRGQHLPFACLVRCRGPA